MSDRPKLPSILHVKHARHKVDGWSITASCSERQAAAEQARLAALQHRRDAALHRLQHAIDPRPEDCAAAAAERAAAAAERAAAAAAAAADAAAPPPHPGALARGLAEPTLGRRPPRPRPADAASPWALATKGRLSEKAYFAASAAFAARVAAENERVAAARAAAAAGADRGRAVERAVPESPTRRAPGHDAAAAAASLSWASRPGRLGDRPYSARALPPSAREPSPERGGRKRFEDRVR